MLPGDQRPHLGVGVGRGADLEGAHARGERGDQPVGGLLANGNGDGNRHAALAGRAVAGAHQRVGGLVHIGVGHDDHVVLGAAQRLHPFPVLGAGAVDVFGDRGGADEGHRLDVRVGEDGVDDFLVAVDDVEHTFREAGLAEQLVGHHRGAGVLLRRLEHEGVSAGDRHRIHPHGHHRREVERRDAGDDAERLAVGVGVDRGADMAGELALQEMRDAAAEFDHLDAALDLADGIGVGLAVLQGDRPGDVVDVGVEQLLEAEHEAGALERRHVGPGGQRQLGSGDRGVELGRRRQRHDRRLLAGRRIEDRRRARAGGAAQLAADDVRDRLHGGHS